MNAEGDGRAYVGDAQVDEQLGRGGSDQKTAVPLICVFSASCRHPVPSLDQGQKHPILWTQVGLSWCQTNSYDIRVSLINKGSKVTFISCSSDTFQ